MFQMVQWVTDSWCNVIGSAGIAILLVFCDSQDDLHNSDEEHVEFAKYYLKDLCFLYTDTDHDDKKVCNPNTIVVHISNDSQQWKGVFCGPFILQTFAAHLSALDSSVKVPGLHDKPSPPAVGGLGMADASVRVVYCATQILLIIDRWRGLLL
jgi:hypothetical protein